MTSDAIMLSIQQLASQIVGRVLANNENLTVILAETFQRLPTLTYQERAATQDLSYGTLRFYGLINYVLQNLLNKPIADQEVRNLLLVSLYQLIFTRAKHYAVVDSAVSIANIWHKRYVKGFINAILRGFLRQQQALLDKAQQTEVGQYSHPQWWIKRMKNDYPSHWQTILLANNEHPPLTLRINCQQTDADHYLILLQKAGLSARKLDTYAVQLDTPVPVDKLPYFFEGHVSVQDWGAQFAATLLDVQEGMHVLDACAAPGGKTCHILEMANVTLTALDKDAQRLRRVQDNLARLHLHARLLCGDASQPRQWWNGQKFERILADVPCSASGVVRRHPDIKWLRRPEDVRQFAAQQSKILDQLWDCLDKDGKLLYTTCSVFPEENIEQIEDFISRHSDAIHQDVSLTHNGQLLPTDAHDGFYYALIQKA